MEPATAIANIESDLRELVRDTLGPSWKTNVGAELVAKLQERHDEEARRRSPVIPPSDLLSYTHLYELRKIINTAWDQFAPVLGKKKEFEVWADQVEDFRNAPAHSRELLGHERTLLEGIAGIIRTRVTLSRTTRGPDLNHYPIVTSAVDSFGNEFAHIPVDQQMIILATQTVLVPGQTVTFRLRASDPQGRPLSWSLDNTLGKGPWIMQGEDVEIPWVVPESAVGLHCHVHIHMKSDGKYHRFHGHDHGVVFRYRVDPPLLEP